MVDAYTPAELQELFATVGTDVFVHRAAALFGAKRIHLGSSVKIGPYSLLSAGQEGIGIGDDACLESGVSLFGSGARITIGPGARIATYAALYTASDDYTTGFLSNPTIPIKYRKLHQGSVTIATQAHIGTGSIVMPGVNIGAHAVVEPLSFVDRNVAAKTVVRGYPARLIFPRC